MEPHALIRESRSDVREVEATGCLRTHFPSRAEPHEDVKQAKMTNMKFGRICWQQYVIVLTKHDGRCGRRVWLKQ